MRPFRALMHLEDRLMERADTSRMGQWARRDPWLYRTAFFGFMAIFYLIFAALSLFSGTHSFRSLMIIGAVPLGAAAVNLGVWLSRRRP
jgi:Zn-dependent protease with chaperone function